MQDDGGPGAVLVAGAGDATGGANRAERVYRKIWEPGALAGFLVGRGSSAGKAGAAGLTTANPALIRNPL